MTPSAHPAEPPAPAARLTLPAPVVLTARELVAALGVSRRTLTTWVQRRIIPSLGAGRVRRFELEQVREALRTHGQAAQSAAAAASPSPGGSGENGAADVS